MLKNGGEELHPLIVPYALPVPPPMLRSESIKYRGAVADVSVCGRPGEHESVGGQVEEHDRGKEASVRDAGASRRTPLPDRGKLRFTTSNARQTWNWVIG